jgi:hypothetical protein
MKLPKLPVVTQDCTRRIFLVSLLCFACFITMYFVTVRRYLDSGLNLSPVHVLVSRIDQQEIVQISKRVS